MKNYWVQNVSSVTIDRLCLSVPTSLKVRRKLNMTRHLKKTSNKGDRDLDKQIQALRRKNNLQEEEKSKELYLIVPYDHEGIYLSAMNSWDHGQWWENCPLILDSRQGRTAFHTQAQDLTFGCEDPVWTCWRISPLTCHATCVVYTFTHPACPFLSLLGATLS